MGSPGKRVCPQQGTEGSNPSLSAMNTDYKQAGRAFLYRNSDLSTGAPNLAQLRGNTIEKVTDLVFNNFERP
jgi:hypothetical protein